MKEHISKIGVKNARKRKKEAKRIRDLYYSKNLENFGLKNSESVEKTEDADRFFLGIDRRSN